MVPAATTIPDSPHLLGRHGLGKVLFETIKEHLAEQGLKLREDSGCQHYCSTVLKEERQRRT
ncbi:MAG: hypothetical protein OXI08_03080 [Cyanobacteria bacterium MAG IRC4_bin_6]|nr:hypothetical protein [Cyanobacteria bacterium MAG IRC4_bin_6]